MREARHGKAAEWQRELDVGWTRSLRSEGMKRDAFKPALVTLIFMAGVLTAGRAELEFSGFLQGPDGVRVTLTDQPAGQSSGWLKLGEGFHGYTLVASDARRVVLEKDGQRIERPLREAKVKAGRMIVRGTVSLGLSGEPSQVEAALFVGEESVFPLSETLTLRLWVERRDDGNLLYRAKFIERKAGGEDVLAAPAVISRPNAPFALRVGDYGFAFSPQP
jgi:hypothetical protein